MLLGTQMKIFKIISFLIILLVITQGIFCAASADVDQSSNALFLQKFVEMQKNKNFIKYDLDKDEIVILLDNSGDRAMLKAFVKMLKPFMFAVGCCTIGLGIASFFKKQMFLGLFENKFNPHYASVMFIFVGLMYLLISVKFLTLAPDKPAAQYIKLTPEGMEKYSDFIMNWKDVASSLKITPNPSKTKIVIRYKTENNSRLLDLDEMDNILCPVSSKDLQELISFYIKKYGKLKLESL